ncbi:MAG: Spy/CpxP family protein refolding chaperone [Myxococcota bacterium]
MYRPFTVTLMTAALFTTACATEEGLGEAEAPLAGSLAEDGDDAAAAVDDDDRGPANVRRHRRRGGPHHRGGPARALMRAVDRLDLSDDQRARIDAMRDEMRAAHRARREAGPPAEMRDMRAALAEAVLTGKVDPAAFSNQLARVEDRARAKTESVLEGLAALREVLTVAQRTALAEDLERRRPRGERGPDRHPDHHRARHDRMAERLGLSEAQREELARAREDAGLDDAPPAHPGPERMAEIMGAFTSDRFDVAALLESSPMPTLARAKAERKLKELSVLTPVLDDAQRTSLSARVAEGPPPRHRRRGPRGPGRR